MFYETTFVRLNKNSTFYEITFGNKTWLQETINGRWIKTRRSNNGPARPSLSLLALPPKAPRMFLLAHSSSPYILLSCARPAWHARLLLLTQSCLRLAPLCRNELSLNVLWFVFGNPLLSPKWPNVESKTVII